MKKTAAPHTVRPVDDGAQGAQRHDEFDIPLRPQDIRYGCRLSALLGIAAMPAMYLMSGDLWMTGVVTAGAAIALVPVFIRIRRKAPREYRDIKALSREGMMYFYTWLAIMAYYVVEGFPLGYALFECVTALVVTGIFFRRFVLPTIVMSVHYWYASAPASASSPR